MYMYIYMHVCHEIYMYMHVCKLGNDSVCEYIYVVVYSLLKCLRFLVALVVETFDRGSWFLPMLAYQ